MTIYGVFCERLSAVHIFALYGKPIPYVELRGLFRQLAFFVLYCHFAVYLKTFVGYNVQVIVSCFYLLWEWRTHLDPPRLGNVGANITASVIQHCRGVILEEAFQFSRRISNCFVQSSPTLALELGYKFVNVIYFFQGTNKPA